MTLGVCRVLLSEAVSIPFIQSKRPQYKPLSIHIPKCHHRFRETDNQPKDPLRCLL
jgi:hypothetical protein